MGRCRIGADIGGVLDRGHGVGSVSAWHGGRSHRLGSVSMGRIRSTAGWVFVAMLTTAVLAVAGCGDDDSGQGTQGEDLTEAGRGFVGTVEGTDAFVALLLGGGEAVVYVCDGSQDISEWFAGPAEGPGIELGNEVGASVSATLSDTGYRGSVTLGDGERHEFEAVAAEPGAGLLRITGPEAEADGVVAGWIVDNDGDYRGSLRVGGFSRTPPAAPGGSVSLDNTSYPVSVFLIPPKTPATPPGVPIPYPNVGMAATSRR